MRATPSAIQLAAILTKVREHWFDLCVKDIEQFEIKHPERRVRVLNRALAGKADLALRAYQLIGAGSFIQNRHYIPKRAEEMYLDSLRVAVWGDNEPAIKDFFVHYYEALISRGEKPSRFRLSTDLACYITGAEPMAGEVLAILPMVLMFSGFTLGEIATAFSDEKEPDVIELELRAEARGAFKPGPKAAEYFYQHGIHEFGLAFGAKYVRTHIAAAKKAVLDEFTSKATRIEPGDPYPIIISYNGRSVYHPQLASAVLAARTDAEKERLAADLGMQALPEPDEVREYGFYPKDAVPGEAIYLGPKVITDAMNSRDLELGNYPELSTEEYAGRKIIRIARDGEGCLDWCFPMPTTASEWQAMAEGLGISVEELKELAGRNS